MEMNKPKINFKQMSILNRNLFDGKFYDTLPKRITSSSEMLIDEFERFFPDIDLRGNCDALVSKLQTITGTNKDNISILLIFEKRLEGRKKSQGQKLFLETNVSRTLLLFYCVHSSLQYINVQITFQYFYFSCSFAVLALVF